MIRNPTLFGPVFALNGSDTVYNCEKAFCDFLLAPIVIPRLAVGGSLIHLGVVKDCGDH